MGKLAVAPNPRIRTRLAVLSDSAAPGTNTLIASGGTVTISSGYVYHTFTASGTFSVYQAGNVDYLVVGGGGGGGTGQGGGGGGGEVKTASATSIAAGSYSVTVGGGGSGGNGGSLTGGATGSSSSLGALVTAGGGGGGGAFDANGSAGGGGGGGGGSYRNRSGGTSAGIGGNGGASAAGGAVSSNQGGGGGGGGGGTAGTAATPSSVIAGAGGNGLTWSNGTTYGGGGGGASAADQPGFSNGTGGTGGGGAGQTSGTGTAGTANTGGGGGGGGYSVGTGNNSGGNGGSGIVIVRYPTDGLLAGLYATGGTIAVNGNNIEHTFSADGNFALAQSGLITVSWTISATGTFDGSGSSGGPANKTATCAVTVTSGTVVVSYQPGAFQPGHPLGLGSNLYQWFDPLTGVTGGATVTQWDDQSGNGLHATPGAAGSPSSGTRTVNGINVIDYDGVNDGLGRTSGISFGITNFTVIGHFGQDDTAIVCGLVNFYLNSAGHDYDNTSSFTFDTANHPASKINAVTINSSEVAYTGSTGAMPAAIWTVRKNGTAVTIWKNGVQVASGTLTATGTADRMSMGWRAKEGGNNLNGFQGQTVIASAAISDAELVRTSTWVSVKSGY